MRFLLQLLALYLVAVIVWGLVRSAWRAARRGAQADPGAGDGPASARDPRQPGLSGEEITDADWREVDE